SLYAQPGKVLFSDSAVDPSTGSVSLRALFPNAERELLPGAFVRIRFPEAVADGVLRVPQRSVLVGAQGQYVLLVDGEGKVTPRPVKIGDMSGGDFVVNEGLKGGEKVIVNGLQKARPGAVVKAIPWNPKAPPMPTAPTPPATAKK
ncbi:MAG: family efflux transporter subunit, partial [Proteobacteria bacterium]|nr:family efflux transporter subunit [Pseudomonadota bacterium]